MTAGGGRLTLVTGGARSGKSRYAEGLAAAGRGPVLYLATAEVYPDDSEMQARIREHQQRRPADWGTLEAPREVGRALAALATTPGTVLLDDLGLLVTNRLLALSGDADPTRETARQLDAALAQELADLDAAQAAGGWDLIVVTNEVGLGIVPATPLGRVFRDAIGRANQLLAARADAVYLLVAGLPLPIKPGRSSS
jgi:adenosylcobinamide kinase/adenosylcobinamide-phosphate guanylyltransferase